MWPISAMMMISWSFNTSPGHDDSVPVVSVSFCIVAPQYVPGERFDFATGALYVVVSAELPHGSGTQNIPLVGERQRLILMRGGVPLRGASACQEALFHYALNPMR